MTATRPAEGWMTVDNPGAVALAAAVIAAARMAGDEAYAQRINSGLFPEAGALVTLCLLDSQSRPVPIALSMSSNVGCSAYFSGVREAFVAAADVAVSYLSDCMPWLDSAAGLISRQRALLSMWLVEGFFTINASTLLAQFRNLGLQSKWLPDDWQTAGYDDACAMHQRLADQALNAFSTAP
jgi:hypothetical protein